MGYVGNIELQFIILLVIVVKESVLIGSRQVKGVEDLDFYIGDEVVNVIGYFVKVRVKFGKFIKLNIDYFFLLICE